MNIFRLTVDVGCGHVAAVVKQGVVASVEIGSQIDRVHQPKCRIVVFLGLNSDIPVAWVQVCEFDGVGLMLVTHEGWVKLGESLLSSRSNNPIVKTTLEKVVSLSPQELKCQENAEFGVFSCCTSYGDGCYVTCCNSCCSDSTACPGASCCA